jgi:tetratricopeptide (TPR) repeat protein
MDPGAAGLTHLAYTITPEAVYLPDEADPSFWRALAQADRQAIHDEVKSNPRRAIERLEPLLQRFPTTPMLLNWLAAAYSNLGQDEKADELVRLNYERNPNYLFARANYAQICLARGDLDRVREIFDNKFDLKLMYPHRDVFHLTEFVAFAGVAIEYLARVGEWKPANSLYDALAQVAPDHPATEQARLFLMRSLLGRALDRLRRGALRRRAASLPGRAGVRPSPGLTSPR